MAEKIGRGKGSGCACPSGHLIEGRNPVLEALKTGREIDKLFLQKDLRDGSARKIYQMAKERRIVVTEAERRRLDEMSETGAHQGVIAQIPAAAYAELSDILQAAQDKGEPPFLVMADGIQDPHNLGSIIRSAHCAGAHGVIIPSRCGVTLSATVEKSAAGALSYIPVCKAGNLVKTAQELKKQNIWFYCADMGGQDYTKTDFSGGVCLVVGSEGAGVSRLMKETCDVCVSIPMYGEIDSLNASVAASILLFEVARGRHQ